MNALLSTLQGFAQPWLVFLAADPALRLLQIAMLLVGFVVIFLVFFTTRDILLRTHSFWYMLLSIALVAALPIVGYFLYLLIRPARTLKEREMEELINEILVEQRAGSRRQPSENKGGVVKKAKKNDAKKENLSL